MTGTGLTQRLLPSCNVYPIVLGYANTVSHILENIIHINSKSHKLHTDQNATDSMHSGCRLCSTSTADPAQSLNK